MPSHISAMNMCVLKQTGSKELRVSIFLSIPFRPFPHAAVLSSSTHLTSGVATRSPLPVTACRERTEGSLSCFEWPMGQDPMCSQPKSDSSSSALGDIVRSPSFYIRHAPASLNGHDALLEFLWLWWKAVLRSRALLSLHQSLPAPCRLWSFRSASETSKSKSKSAGTP